MGLVSSITSCTTREYPYPITRDGKVFPLEELDKLLLLDEPPEYVVISVTGNDVLGLKSDGLFNRVWMNSQRAPSVDELATALHQKGWHTEYERVIDALVAKGVHVIPVVLFLPEQSFTEIPPEQAKQLHARLSRYMLDATRKHSLPVIDLSRTFNPLDASDYGVCGHTKAHTKPIEPSSKGGMYIARLVKRVIEEHDWSASS